MRPTLWCAAVLAAVSIVGGCGSSDDDVRETVNKYFTALADRDVRTACSLVSPVFREELANWAKTAHPDLCSRDCEVIARRIAQVNDDRLVGLQRDVSVNSVEIDGDTAKAALGAGQVATLRRVDGDWLVERLDFRGATS